MTAVGSSKTRSQGSLTNALAISTICRSASVRSPIRAKAEIDTPSLSSAAWTRFCRALGEINPRGPRGCSVKGDVLSHRQFREERELLMDDVNPRRLSLLR